MELTYPNYIFDIIFKTLQQMKIDKYNHLTDMNISIVFPENDDLLLKNNANSIVIETYYDVIGPEAIKCFSKCYKIEISIVTKSSEYSSLVIISIPSDINTIEEDFFKGYKSMTKSQFQIRLKLLVNHLF